MSVEINETWADGLSLLLSFLLADQNNTSHRVLLMVAQAQI